MTFGQRDGFVRREPSEHARATGCFNRLTQVSEVTRAGYAVEDDTRHIQVFVEALVSVYECRRRARHRRSIHD